MKCLRCLSLFVLMVALAAIGAKAQAQTSFTYQGVLEVAGGSVSGNADLRFRLYTDATNGQQIGPEIVKHAVALTRGVFTTELDFGDGAFLPGAPRWLEIDARSPAGSGSYVNLSPRLAINPAPLAQGIAGMPITRAGTESVDQNQLNGYSGGGVTTRLDISPSWETFTAGKSGTLTRIDMDGYGLVPNFRTLTVYLRKGGIDGPILGTSSLLVKPGQSGVFSLPFDNVTLVAGTQYTIDPRGIVFLIVSNGDIPGASAGPSAGNRFVFRTYVAPQATIDIKASKAALADAAMTVDWNGIGNIPANVSSANSPWVATAGGSRLTGGFAQIDTGVRLQFGGATENGDPIALRRFNFANEQSGLEMILGDDYGISNANDAFIITASGTTIFQFNTQSGGQALKAGGGSWGVLSDARAKHDIEPLDGALDRLLKLRGKTYFYNDPHAAGAGAGAHTGFVAQEVEPFFPEWIGRTNDGMKTLNITGFEALTVESLRELRTEKDDQIARLRAESDSRLAEKQREIDDLKQRLERLERAVNAPH